MLTGRFFPGSITFRGRSTWILLAVFIGFGWCQSSPAAQAPTDTLILVNEDPITVGDFDRLVMQAHRTMTMGDQDGGLAGRLLEKRVKDILLIQDALAAGMDQDPAFVQRIEQKERSYAIQQYVKDNLTLPKTASPDSVRAFFERYFWRVQFRQLSLRTIEDTESMKAAVIAGADMDSLAREFSLDSKNLKGGLHNLLYWADVENIFRDQLRTLEEGQLSAVFPINDAFAFLRVERLLPLHEEEFDQIKKSINPIILTQQRQEAWDSFVKDKASEVSIQEDVSGIMSILGDSTIILKPEFQKTQPANILEAEDGSGISGTEFRKKLSYAYKSDTSKPFATRFQETRDLMTKELVLGQLAKRDGYFENKDVVQRINDDWEQGLLELYLEETVAPQITFNKAEFEEFYNLNQEQFRGPEEVRLDILVLKNETDAEEASRRLKQGADFGRIFKEYNNGQELGSGKPKFIKETELSDAIREEMKVMEPGQSSNALKMGMGFMVFRLDAKRPGAVPPLAAVEMDIRRALYQGKFKEAVDRSLDLLRENSTIKRWPDRIEEYFLPDGGDK